MSIFFCEGCNEYYNSDESGRHDHCEWGEICDNCEGLSHELFYFQSMVELNNLSKEGA